MKVMAVVVMMGWYERITDQLKEGILGIKVKRGAMRGSATNNGGGVMGDMAVVDVLWVVVVGDSGIRSGVVVVVVVIVVKVSRLYGRSTR